MVKRRHSMTKLILVLVFFVLFAKLSFACIGHPGANCRSGYPLPTSGFDKISQEIHGNGKADPQTKDLADRRSKIFIRDIQDLDRLAQRYDKALDGILHIAYLNLRQYDFDDEAAELKSGWRQHKGEIQELVYARHYRDIGDFAGISAWLDKTY